MRGKNILVTQERLDMVVLNKDLSSCSNLLTWHVTFMKITNVCKISKYESRYLKRHFLISLTRVTNLLVM